MAAEDNPPVAGKTPVSISLSIPDLRETTALIGEYLLIFITSLLLRMIIISIASRSKISLL